MIHTLPFNKQRREQDGPFFSCFDKSCLSLTQATIVFVFINFIICGVIWVAFILYIISSISNNDFYFTMFAPILFDNSLLCPKGSTARECISDDDPTTAAAAAERRWLADGGSSVSESWPGAISSMISALASTSSAAQDQKMLSFEQQVTSIHYYMTLFSIYQLVNTYKTYIGYRVWRQYRMKPRFNLMLLGNKEYEMMAKEQEKAFNNWNHYMRISVEEYYRITMLFTISYILQTVIVVFSLSHYINSAFEWSQIIMMLWLILNAWTTSRLLTIKNQDLQRHWRQEEAFTYDTKKKDVDEEEEFAYDGMKQLTIKTNPSVRSTHSNNTANQPPNISSSTFKYVPGQGTQYKNNAARQSNSSRNSANSLFVERQSPDKKNTVVIQSHGQIQMKKSASNLPVSENKTSTVDEEFEELRSQISNLGKQPSQHSEKMEGLPSPMIVDNLDQIDEEDGSERGSDIQ